MQIDYGGKLAILSHYFRMPQKRVQVRSRNVTDSQKHPGNHILRNSKTLLLCHHTESIMPRLSGTDQRNTGNYLAPLNSPNSNQHNERQSMQSWEAFAQQAQQLSKSNQASCLHNPASKAEFYVPTLDVPHYHRITPSNRLS